MRPESEIRRQGRLNLWRASLLGAIMHGEEMAVGVKDASSFAFGKPQALFDANGLRTGGAPDPNL
jgi:hypothetical protein